MAGRGLLLSTEVQRWRCVVFEAGVQCQWPNFAGIQKLYSSHNLLRGPQIELCTFFRSNLGKRSADGPKELKHAQLWEQKIHQSEVAAGVAQWENPIGKSHGPSMDHHRWLEAKESASRIHQKYTEVGSFVLMHLPFGCGCDMISTVENSVINYDKL